MQFFVNDIAVMWGRVAVVGIVLLGVLLGGKATDGFYFDTWDAFWLFINTALIPVAFGVLITVASEIVLRLGSNK